MSFPDRIRAGIVIILLVWIILGVARCRREFADLQIIARDGWVEVARLRATLAAHGIDPDLSESHHPEPTTTPTP